MGGSGLNCLQKRFPTLTSEARLTRRSAVFYWIYDYPSLNIGALFGVVFVAATWLLILFIRLSFHSWIHGEKRANDMVGFALCTRRGLADVLHARARARQVVPDFGVGVWDFNP